MPFKEKIAGRIREILSITHKNVEEKKCLVVYVLWSMIKCVLVLKQID
jgi:hypothetical protein